MVYKIHPVTGRKIEYECKIEFNKIELAWCAGFFDGEGCTYVYLRRFKRSKSVWAIRAQISQVDIRPLLRFKEATKISKIYKRLKNGREINELIALTFEEVQQCMILLWPYLSEPKKEQYKRNLENYMRFRDNKKKIA